MNTRKQTLQDIKTLKHLGFDYALERKGFLHRQQYYTNQQYPISKVFNSKLQVATNACMNLFQESYEYLMKNIESYEDTFISLGYHTNLIKAFINSKQDEFVSNLSRIDFLINDKEEIKFCEINSATPQGVFENVVCAEYFKERYNVETVNKDLITSFKSMWSDVTKEYEVRPTLYVSAEASYNEDVQTVMLHKNTYGGQVKFIDLRDIKVTPQGVFDSDSNKIELMFMLYPIEFLPHDIDYDGFETGSLFLDLISKGKIKMVNPLSATLIQSKNFVTIIDKLVKENKLSKESCNTYKQYFPVSEVWNGTKEQILQWLDNKDKVVIKPVFGRTGKAVQIVTKENLEHILQGYSNLPTDEDLSWYVKQPHILQEYCEDRTVDVELLDGKTYKLNLVFGAYAVNLKYSGLYLRGDSGCTTDQCILVHPVYEN